MSSPQRSVLIIEDSDTDYEIVLWAFRKVPCAPKLLRFQNGESALNHLMLLNQRSAAEMADWPAMLMLDLNLPGLSGVQVLQQIRATPCTSLLPVIIFSTSSRPSDIELCYRNGANSYLIKPLELSNMRETLDTIVRYWLHQVALPEGPSQRSL